ncbi:MAG: hypothetical protein H6702_16705 [Myxococcales bacterium]|nr:hypothetical protein [Myxococcales bacterium]
MRWLFTALMIPAVAVAQGPSDFRDGVELSPEQQLAQAAASVENIRQTLKFGLERQKEAAAKGDIIKVNCVNAVLTDLRAQTFLAQSYLAALQGGLEPDVAQLEVMKINAAEMMAGQYRGQIESCVGEASSYTGLTLVDVQVSDDIRQDDASVENENSVFPPVDATRPEALTGSQ